MDYGQLIALAMNSLVAATQLIAELKAQSGMSDEQLLAVALSSGEDVHAAVKKLLAEPKPPTA